MIQTGISAHNQDEHLEALRAMLRESGTDKPYPKSFSFASSEIPSQPEMSLEEYIKRTDTKMYQYKVQHKKPLKDMVYQDHRV